MSRNRYEKIKVLGSGSYGEAWLVKSNNSQRHYVVKEMKILPHLPQTERDRVHNEVSIIRSCFHLNIIKYKDFFITQGDNCQLMHIVMEYAECGDLNQRIQKQREVEKEFFPESQIRNWFVQICFALQYLHKKSIIHRDVKAQNIFITSNNILKLGDFGISKTLTHEQDYATTGIGTPQYVSPEICSQKRYDYKSDIWSLGCVLYELCALSPAFPGPDFFHVMDKILKGIFKPIPPVFCPSIAELVRVMLRPDPARRPTVAQLLVATVLQDDVTAYIKFIKDLTITGDIISSTNGSGSGGSQIDLRKNSTSSLSSVDGQQVDQGH